MNDAVQATPSAHMTSQYSNLLFPLQANAQKEDQRRPSTATRTAYTP